MPAIIPPSTTNSAPLVNAEASLARNTIVPATSTDPPMEEVTFVFGNIVQTFTDGGIEHEDSWKEQA
jgi:type VI secretion system secreted protein Hcp